MEKPYVLGIDIGGQTAKCGIVNARGEVLAQTILVSNKHDDAPSFVEALAQTLKKLILDADLEGQIRGIGVGAPNGNYYTGEIKQAPNLSWAHEGNVPFAAMLSKAMDDMPVALTNDANAAAVGEMTYGAAKGLKNFIMITLGTGVGSGIVIDGKVLYGHDGFAGELGHTCAVRGGRRCGCGKLGCLEAYCSAIGVARTAVEWLDQHPEESSLLRLRENVTSKDVYEAAKAGDKMALEIFEYTGSILGRSFADFIAFSAPEAIVLFGGLARAKEFLTAPILEAMNDNVLPLWRDKVKLLYSSLSESDAAILGASALAWNL
ncbi:MAG: ROK family protein [Bacteroidales bacterium]|nr:ROK family protein [Bacteroidales bacterium]MBO4566641.1 ROK family protein [Bacteroidales bacterium]